MGVPPPATTTSKNTSKESRPISDNRRIRKPIMEKKRRDRINNCLDELANILIEADLVKPEQSKNPKIEKADILELTVKYWQDLKSKTESSEADILNTTEETDSSFLKGYKECVRMTDTLLEEIDEATGELRREINNHLQVKIKELTPPKTSTESSIDTWKTANIKSSIKKPNSTAQNLKPGLALIPKKLEDGTLIFVLQNHIQNHDTKVKNNKNDIEKISSDSKHPFNASNENTEESPNNTLNTLTNPTIKDAYNNSTKILNDHLKIIHLEDKRPSQDHLKRLVLRDSHIDDQELVDIIAENGIDINMNDETNDDTWRPW